MVRMHSERVKLLEHALRIVRADAEITVLDALKQALNGTLTQKIEELKANLGEGRT